MFGDGIRATCTPLGAVPLVIVLVLLLVACRQSDQATIPPRLPDSTSDRTTASAPTQLAGTGTASAGPSTLTPPPSLDVGRTSMLPHPAGFDPGQFIIINKNIVGHWKVTGHREEGPNGNIFLNNVYVATLELGKDGAYCVTVRDGAKECGTYSFIEPNRIRFETPPPTGVDIYQMSYAENELTLRDHNRIVVVLHRSGP